MSLCIRVFLTPLPLEDALRQIDALKAGLAAVRGRVS